MEGFRELLERGARAFQQRQYAEAASAFNAIRAEYAEEPEWIEGDLPQRLLPLAGFASMRAAAYEDAVDALTSFFGEYADKSAAPQDFTRYTLALSELRLERPDKARAAFAAMRERASNPSIACIASICEARLSDDATAIALLQTAIASEASERTRIQATLALIRRSLDNGSIADACNQLLGTSWESASMPELASLTFLAIEVGDLLRDTEPAKALTAYRIALPRDELERQQAERLASLEIALRDRTPQLGPEQIMWVDFYHQIVANMRSQLDALRCMDDYGPSLDLRKASCFVRLGRHLEAWTLLEPLAQSPNPDIAPAAHLLWIRVARSLRFWKSAALIAAEFVDRYPDREDADEALYWIAQTQLELEDFSGALATFQRLVQRSKSPLVVATAQYFSGVCLAQSRRWSDAILFFEKSASALPDKPIAGQATIWIGIAQFSLDEYETAALTFDIVAQNPVWSSLWPEALFRKATTLYALGQYTPTIDLLQSWLAEYKSHERRNEALLLAGDAFAANHRHEDAIAAYDAVDPDDRETRLQATQSAVRLLLERGDHEPAANHCREFADGPIPPQSAGSFFLLWSDCLRDTGKDAEANRILELGISQFGNDLNAIGIVELIAAAGAIGGTTDSDSPTLRSRRLLARIHNLNSHDHTIEAKTLSLKLVSDFAIESLPPECLLAAGIVLNEIGSFDGRAYFDRCLSLYPDSAYAGQVHVSLARLDLKEKRAKQGLQRLAAAFSIDPALADETDTLMLRADLLSAAGQSEDASADYGQILSKRAAPPRAKAQALSRLGSLSLQNDDPLAAYAYFQRVFTLYRGELDQVAPSYLHCMRILSQQGNYDLAAAVGREFLSQADLAAYPEFASAQKLQPELERLNELATANAANPIRE